MLIHDFSRKYRAVFVAGAGVALVVAFTRCTPLNSSIEKSALLSRGMNPASGNPFGGPAGPGAVVTIPSPIPVLPFQLRVLDSDAFEDKKVQLSRGSETRALENSNSSERRKIVELSDTQIDELRNNRATIVSMGGVLPSEAILYLKVAIPRGSFESNDLGDFILRIQPLSEGKWLLSVPVSADKDHERVNNLVLPSLEGALIVAQTSEQPLVKSEATPAPTATPSVSARPSSEDPL